MKNLTTKNFFKRSIVTLFTVSTGLLIVSLNGTSAFAATSSNGSPNGFSISPVLSKITINKGQSSTLTILLQNPTSLPLQAQAVVNDFQASADETGTPSIILNNNAPAPANNFRSLISAIPSITISPNQQASVQVTVSVPSNANSGGYYGAIRFLPISTAQKSNVGLTASVGTLVLVTVPGNLVDNMSLVQLSAANNGVTSNVFTSGNPLSVVTRLKNTGNIYFAPFGKVQVVSMFNKVVASYEFNSTQGNILPGSIRKYTHVLPNYHWFGRYKIEANLGYGNSGGLVSDSVTFWYIPTWFIVLAIIVIVLLVAVIYGVINTVKKRRIRSSHRH